MSSFFFFNMSSRYGAWVPMLTSALPTQPSPQPSLQSFLSLDFYLLFTFLSIRSTLDDNVALTLTHAYVQNLS